MRYKNKSKLRKLFAGGDISSTNNDFVDGASSQIAEKLLPGSGIVAQAGSLISNGIGDKVGDITGNSKVGKAANYLAGGPAGLMKAGMDALSGNFLGKKDEENKKKEMQELIDSVTAQGKNNYTAATNAGFKPQGNPYATMAEGGKLPEPKLGKGKDYSAVRLTKAQKAKFTELDKKGTFTLADIDPQLAEKYGNLMYTGKATPKKETPVAKDSKPKVQPETKVQAPAKKGILNKAVEKGKEIYEESKKIYNEGNRSIKPGVSYVDKKGELRTAKYMEDGASPEEDMVVTYDSTGDNGRRVRYQDILSQLPEFANGGRLKTVTGQKHENGGTPIDIDGNTVPRNKAIVEAEKGEVVDKKTDVVFSDRVKVPGTNKTFAEQVMKDKKNPKKVDFLADLQVQVSEGVDEQGRRFKKTYTPENVYGNQGNYPLANQDQKPISKRGKALQAALKTARETGIDEIDFDIKGDGNVRKYKAGTTKIDYLNDINTDVPAKTPPVQTATPERKKLFTVNVGGGATGQRLATGGAGEVKAGIGSGNYEATNATSMDIYEGDAIPEGARGRSPQDNQALQAYRKQLQQKKWGGKLPKASDGIQMNRRSKMDAFEEGVPDVNTGIDLNKITGKVGKGLSSTAPFADNILNGVLNIRRAKSISNLPQQGTTDYVKANTVDNSKAISDIKVAAGNAASAITGASAQNMNANKAGMLGETLDAISRSNESTANINAQAGGQANQVNAGIQAQNNAIKFQNASDRFRAKDEIMQETSKNMSNVVDKVNMQKLDKEKFALASDQQLVDLATSDPRSVAYLKANIAPDRFERLFGMPKRSIGGKLRKKYAY